MTITPQFHAALLAAETYHHKQKRKGTIVPYFSHLLGVASLVLEAGGSEPEAIAALLHDAPEDCGGAPVLAEIEKQFGAQVAAIVEGCSDAMPLDGEAKPPWRRRKIDYIEHLRGADASTMLVSAADKLHNLRAIQSDYLRIGNAIFERVSADEPKRSTVLWYYRELYDVYIATSSPRDRRRSALTRPIEQILDWFDANIDTYAETTCKGFGPG